MVFKTRHYTSSSSSRFRHLATRPRPVTAAKTPRYRWFRSLCTTIGLKLLCDLPADYEADACWLKLMCLLILVLVDADSEARWSSWLRGWWLNVQKALGNTDSDAHLLMLTQRHLCLAIQRRFVDTDSERGSTGFLTRVTLIQRRYCGATPEALVPLNSDALVAC